VISPANGLKALVIFSTLLRNNGLSVESVRQLPKHQARKMYLSTHDESKAQGAVTLVKSIVPDAKIEFLLIDLTSLKPVKLAADTFNSFSNRLDILMNNARIIAFPERLAERKIRGPIRYQPSRPPTGCSQDCSCARLADTGRNRKGCPDHKSQLIGSHLGPQRRPGP
jgi:hypothetical protein